MGRRKKKKYSFVYVIFAVIVMLSAVIIDSNFGDSIHEYIESLEVYSLIDLDEDNTKAVEGSLVVDFIDVGQGDSILIRQGSHAMLIDGGTSESKQDLLGFLESENVSSFDYIIGTHPHEDHIGSLDDVVNSYDFDTILFPKVTTTTKTFENLVLAVKGKNKKFVEPEINKEYTLGDAKFTILAPNSKEYDSLNNYSIVIKLTYGKNSFIFTGDAESLSESEILKNNVDLKADVLKIGHHGSSTSTSAKFLNAVSPKYAVISVGKDNSYNHPTKTTMNRLKKLGIPVYRTDEQGTIECVSNGETISFNVDAGTYSYMGN